MEQKLTRQQRRKIDREYRKRFLKAEKKVNRTIGLKVEKVEDKKQNDSGSICFPSFYIEPGNNETDFQFVLRAFSDVISIDYADTPPTVMFIVIFKPHPYESDEIVEKVSRTILSKTLYDNIIMFIHRDDFLYKDIEELSEEEIEKLSDEIVSTFCKENYDAILENLEICFKRMRGDDTDE
ncbi:hypothetical protein J5I95_15895 [Candidatus Poribacteria bacterium]|nr:hypothetical protein [Candidatus Poribacteria bacterium]